MDEDEIDRLLADVGLDVPDSGDVPDDGRLPLWNDEEDFEW